MFMSRQIAEAQSSSCRMRVAAKVMEAVRDTALSRLGVVDAAEALASE
jgi:hypothetical protein